MNRNKLDDTAEDIQAIGDEDRSPENIPSHSSNFKDLYDELLSTLDTTPERKSTKGAVSNASAPLEKNGRMADSGNYNYNRTLKTDTGPKRRASNIEELMGVIDSNIKSEVKRSPGSSSANNSFKDNIVSGEIFDSVVQDLNKQKAERSEKKKDKQTYRSESEKYDNSYENREIIPPEGGYVPFSDSNAEKSLREDYGGNYSDYGNSEYRDYGEHREVGRSKKRRTQRRPAPSPTDPSRESVNDPLNPSKNEFMNGPLNETLNESVNETWGDHLNSDGSNADSNISGGSNNSDNDSIDNDGNKNFESFSSSFSPEATVQRNKKRRRRSAGRQDENISEEISFGRKKSNRLKNKDSGDEEGEADLLRAFGLDYGAETENDDSEKFNEGGGSRRMKSPKASPKIKSMHKVTTGEYVSYEQNNDIFGEYRKIYTSGWVKLAVSAICLLILLYMEIAPHFKLPLPYFLDTNFYNAVYILIDAQILLIVAWFNRDLLIFGIKSIFASVVNVYYISVVFVFLTFIHTFFTYILRYNNPDMVLFNSVTVLGLALACLHSILDTNIEVMGFKVVSSKKPKYTVYLNENSELEMDGFRDIIPENTTVGNILKTNFSSNFFSRINKKKIYGSYEKHFLVISVCVAALLFAVLLGFKVDKYTALSSSVTVLLCSIPMCSVIVSIFPMYKMQKASNVMSSAFVGCESINDHSKISIVSVYDRDIFPPDQVKILSVRVYGSSNRLETVLQHFCAVFEKLNFALAESFKSSTSYDSSFDRNVDILSIDENGVCFISNGRKLFMGNSEYMSNIGLSAIYDRNFDEQFLKSSGSILFLSSDSEIISKICIKYEIVTDFFDILKALGKANVCLGVRTFDPSIDDELIRKMTNFKKFPVKVIKLHNPNDAYIIPESLESGIVSKGSLKSLIKTILLCSKTKNVIKSNILIQTIAFIAGIGLTALVTVLGIVHNEIWTVNSLYIMLFHLFWMCPIVFLSGLTPN